MKRRAFLAGTLTAGLARADVEYSEDDLRNLKLEDFVEGGRRSTLLTPRFLNRGTKIPLVVFLHGLGETTNEKLGAYAWLEKYGLGSAWQRLKRAPIERTSKRGEWTDPHLAEVNAELAARPFRGFAMACPFMPNTKGAAENDAYAKWLETSLLPYCKKQVNVSEVHLCGVSLGGYVSLEVLVRTPGLWNGWAGVQTAIGEWAAKGYAEKIAKQPARPMMLLTSSQDHFKGSSEALAAALTSLGRTVTARVLPGPHDQPWLREAGTIETLHWLDRLDKT